MPTHKIQIAPELVAEGKRLHETTLTPPSDIAAVSQQQRAALAVRIRNVVEREIAAVERVLDAVGAADGGEAERSARTLASVSRTLREIAALNQPDEVTPPDEADDDPIPRDIDEFRRELARRIRGFIDVRRNRAAGISDEPEASLE